VQYSGIRLQNYVSPVVTSLLSYLRCLLPRSMNEQATFSDYLIPEYVFLEGIRINGWSFDPQQKTNLLSGSRSAHFERSFHIPHNE